MENQSSDLPVTTSNGLQLATKAVASRHKEVLNARKSTLFVDFSADDKMVSLESIVKTAYLDAGHTIPGLTQRERMDHVKAIAMRLIVIIQERFPLITGSEIRLACRSGASGAYGDFHGISPRTIMGWLQEYNTQRGAIILAESQHTPLPSIPKPTDEEWMNMMCDKLRKTHMMVTEGKEPVDYGNVLFKFLREKGLITLTQEDIDSYIEQAKAQIIADNDPSDARSIGERIERRTLIKVIMTEQTHQEAVMIRARGIALREYLLMIDDIDSEIDKLKKAF